MLVERQQVVGRPNAHDVPRTLGGVERLLLTTPRVHRCRIPCVRRHLNSAGLHLWLAHLELRWFSGKERPPAVHACARRRRALAAVASSRVRQLLRQPAVLVLVAVWDRRQV